MHGVVLAPVPIIKAVVSPFNCSPAPENKQYLILAFEKNKKIRTILKRFEKHFNFIICSETKIRSSMPCQEMITIFSKREKIDYNINLQDAITKTIYKSKPTDLIVIIGSHFMAPTLNKIFKNCFAHK